MKVYFERIGVLASLLMFFFSGMAHISDPFSDVDRLSKASPLALGKNHAAFLIFLAGLAELVAVIVIMCDLFYDGKLNTRKSVYAYAFLILFTISVTILFYANPFSRTFKKTATLSNITTIGSLLVGLSLVLKNSPVASFYPITF